MLNTYNQQVKQQERTTDKKLETYGIKTLIQFCKTVTAHNDDNTLACGRIKDDAGKKLESKAHVCRLNRSESAKFEN